MIGLLKKPTLPPAVRKFIRRITSLGGKARAAKYDKKTLSKWAKKGGRPRKRKEQR
jgi:hypothetical protein